uniref:PDR_CDR domain-containing protein n=1 Tax=Globodera pallida TaxID=36090 RepID=A0A183C406_GLOPA
MPRRRFRLLWDRFCVFTDLPGFRLMHSAIPRAIRMATIFLFFSSLAAMNAQLGYLLVQYLRSQVQTSTRKYRLERMALPFVYLCHQLNGTRPLPLLDLCYDSVFKRDADDLSGDRRMQNVVPICSYQIKAFEYRCELRCKWTSQGFCMEARPNRNSKKMVEAANKSSSGDENENEAERALWREEANAATEADDNFDEVSTYDIHIHFNSSASVQQDVPSPGPGVPALALVFLRFGIDAQKCANKVPLIVHNDLADSQLEPGASSYEFCHWKKYSELGRRNGDNKCSSEYMTDFFAADWWEFSNVTYSSSDVQCALERSLRAQQNCREERVHNRFTVETAIYTRSDADGDADDGRAPSTPNLHIYPGDVVMQETLHQLRSNVWKMTSEFGGTLALYLGFSLMSFLEALIFFTVPKVRLNEQIMDEVEKSNVPKMEENSSDVPAEYDTEDGTSERRK